MLYLKKTVALALIAVVFSLQMPAYSQDVLPSSEFSGGASVFTFKESRKKKHRKASTKTNLAAKRKPQQRKKAVTRSRRQLADARRTKPRPSTKPVEPATVKPPAGNTAAAKKRAAITYAGAAEFQLERGDHDEAIRLFREALKLDPTNLPAKLGLSDALTAKADVLADGENLDLAVRNYEEAKKLNPENHAAFAGLGEVQQSLGRDRDAVTNFEAALKKNPALNELYLPLGISYYNLGEIAKADENLTKAAAQNPESAEAKMYLGLVRMKQNKNGEAASEIKSSLAIDSNNADAHYFLATAYASDNRDGEARAAYAKALDADPRHVDARFDLAVSDYNAENYAAAAEGYHKVVTEEPTHGDAQYYLGDTFRQQERHDRASEQYGVAAVYVKDEPELYSSWGYSLGHEKKWESAGDKLKTASEMRGDAVDHSNVAWAYNNGAEVDKTSGNEKAAGEKLAAGRDSSKKATELNPNLGSAFVNLGTALNGLGEHDNAVIALERAVTLNGDWYFALNELGRAYRSLGRFADAIARFDRAVKLNGKFTRGLYYLAEAQYASGDKKAAAATRKVLKGLDPTLEKRLGDVISGKIKSEFNKVDPRNKIPTNIPRPRFP